MTTKEKLNAAVKQLVKLNRPAAVEVLARFGVTTTAELQPEAWQDVFEACEEALKKVADGAPQ